MGYDARWGGALKFRENLPEEERKKALEILKKATYFYDNNGEIEVSDSRRYYENEWVELRPYFVGDVSFIGEDDARWTLFFEDGNIYETSPIEIGMLPGESQAETLGRYIAENGINPRQVLEAMPDFVAAVKIWYKGDIIGKIKEKGIEGDIDAIYEATKKSLNLDTHEAAQDGEWDAIDFAIEAAVEELSAKKVEPEDVYYTPRIEVTNGKQVAHAWQNWGSFDEPSKAYAVAKGLLKDVRDLKFMELLTPEEKKAGYFLNVAIETVVNGSLVAVEDFKG